MKKTSALARAVIQIDFFGLRFGGVPGGVAPKNFRRQNCVCSSTTLQKLDFDVLWFRRRRAYKI